MFYFLEIGKNIESNIFKVKNYTRNIIEMHTL